MSKVRLIPGAGGFIGGQQSSIWNKKAHKFVRLIENRWMIGITVLLLLRVTCGVREVYNLAADMGGGALYAVGFD